VTRHPRAPTPKRTFAVGDRAMYVSAYGSNTSFDYRPGRLVARPPSLEGPVWADCHPFRFDDPKLANLAHDGLFCLHADSLYEYLDPEDPT
jgi:hypothetical protein